MIYSLLLSALTLVVPAAAGPVDPRADREPGDDRGRR